MKYKIRVHDEGVEGLWAEIDELPGCFASGRDVEELKEALLEAITLYLSTPTPLPLRGHFLPILA